MKEYTRTSAEFIDACRIYLKAGNGGDGAASFRREKFIPFGGPDGGHGGKGGDIWFEATSNVTTLSEVAFHPHITVPDASPGGGNKCDGAKSEDKTVYVPIGTVIKRDGRIIADLKENGQRFLAAKGGRGGRGNTAFKTQFNTAPRISEKGEPGECFEVILELSILADVGLIGFPNAGKSTLLSTVSAARPKIADYPFTTISPNIGMVSHKGKTFAMADIPGLIEGAHEGKGLGDVFLRHILRTKLLIHLVDPQGFQDTPPENAIKIIENELKSFSPILARKKIIIAVTKADLPEAEKTYKKLKARYRKRDVFLISSAASKGINQLLDKIIKTLPEIKQEDAYKTEEKQKTIAPEVKKGLILKRDPDGIMRVEGEKILKIVAMTNFSQLDSWDRLRRIFKVIGLDKALKKAGIAEGNIVRIGNREFEWSDEPLPSRKPGKFAYKYRNREREEYKKRMKE
ncbi:MAG: GTPase ObgE [Elusimicrobiales bacterium]|nr:GTPase ObgE [Elusimicrobiales bacterium]